jgi:iron complex transport system ATP-binding protein
MYAATAIEVRAGGKILLEEAGVTVVPGSVTVLVGPNGAGKSTLLKVLAGEIRPRDGSVAINGRMLRELAPRQLAAMRAVLPQSVHVAFPFSVAEVVGIGASGQQLDLKVRRVLARVDMLAFRDRPYDRLSGGEMQRVQLARVLLQLENGVPPGYLLLDEPTASLDLAHQLLVIRLMRTLAGEGLGVLAILHDLNLAAMAADRIVALRHGRVAAEGTPAEIMTDEAIEHVYGVRSRANWTPDTPFLLPQGVGDSV